MKKINIKISEGGCDVCSAAAPMPEDPRGHMHTSDCEKPADYKNAHNNEEARMHRTTLAHLVADVKVLLDLIEDEDDLPEWLETKITKAGDYMSSAARYIAGNTARDQGQLEEGFCEIDTHHELHELLQDAITEDYEMACPECLYETMVDAACDCSEMLSEAEYRGRKVKLNKPMRGDVKKFKVYVKDPKTGNIKKVNFGHGGTSAKRKGEKTMRIRKSNPKARKNFRKRHNCKNPGPKTKARYWSCKKW
jgi:hypothetical protein